MAKKEITDFGSKIGGARKDVWIKRGLCVEDIKDMTASEKEKYIKRDYIWPKPDIQEELEKGFSRFIGMVLVILLYPWIKTGNGSSLIQRERKDYESIKHLMNLSMNLRR